MTHNILDKLCEIVPEEDEEVIRELLFWNFEDEMEIEEDELASIRAKWNEFALKYRSREESDESILELWKKVFVDQTLLDISRQIFI